MIKGKKNKNQLDFFLSEAKYLVRFCCNSKESFLSICFMGLTMKEEGQGKQTLLKIGKMYPASSILPKRKDGLLSLS